MTGDWAPGQIRDLLHLLGRLGPALERKSATRDEIALRIYELRFVNDSIFKTPSEHELLAHNAFNAADAFIKVRDEKKPKRG